MLLNPYRFPPESVSRLVFPLTYDEKDSDNSLALTRIGAAAPLVTPQGFVGDGYDARLLTTNLPSWVNPGMTLTLHGSVDLHPDYVASLSSDQMLFGLTTNTSNWWPYLAFCQGYTPGHLAVSTLKYYSNDTSSMKRIPLARSAWAYCGREPELTVSGNSVLPQAAIFLDADTLLLSGHASGTESVVYKIRLSDWAQIGRFTFGTATYRHVSSFAKRSNDDFWCADYETGKLLRIDLASSFSSGTAVISQVVDSSSLSGTGAIEFATIGATEYLLLAQYNTADASGYLNLFPATALAGATLSATDRFKRFVVGRRVQGIAMRSGSLLVSRNTQYGSTSAHGFLETYDITGMATSLADEQIVNSSTNATYLLSTFHAPGPYPQDIAIHPVSNRAYIPTEGHDLVGDIHGWLGVWHSSLSAYAQETYHLTAEFDGVSTTVIKVNGRPFHTLTGSSPQYNPTILCIGGRPSAVAAGFGNGCTVSTVRNVALQNQPLSADDYSAIISGGYETSTLTTYTLTLTNAGAESGSAVGWTNETGTITAKNTANRTPPEGSWYFDGGSTATCVARQRVDLVSAGMSTGQLDSGNAWASLSWYQAAFDSNDPGGMGVRTLNGSLGTIATSYSPLVYTTGGTGAAPFYWHRRRHPAQIAALTRHLDALYNASGRTSGTNNDHYVDDIRLKVYVP